MVWVFMTGNQNSYSFLQNFLHARLMQNFLEDGPLHSIHWHRVVLDEAHTIKAFRSNSSQAVFQLTADRRWCLTGTPIQVKYMSYHHDSFTVCSAHKFKFDGRYDGFCGYYRLLNADLQVLS